MTRQLPSSGANWLTSGRAVRHLAPLDVVVGVVHRRRPSPDSRASSSPTSSGALTGLGPVECQAEVTDDRGFAIARADLWLVGTTRIHECDGDAHRTPDGHAEDLRRDRALTRAGWARYGYPPQEIARRPDRIIRDAEEARGLPHDPERVRDWWHLAQTSTLTGHGRARLASRLHRYRLAAVKVPAGSRRRSAA